MAHGMDTLGVPKLLARQTNAQYERIRRFHGSSSSLKIYIYAAHVCFFPFVLFMSGRAVLGLEMHLRCRSSMPVTLHSFIPIVPYMLVPTVHASFPQRVNKT
ncbi:hypothetical protein B0J13DRAFT_98953 [Dactylonectria estremocensis]|uniref:Transmembrane protein n=1 Tax=Dactylonectria estremocensis TaxID=1079267 RepID=A0A9P9E9E4_9HYPO|nr:hypothetical protein B0J13DRAFT_98953 [Dactylonectria estremocensis]